MELQIIELPWSLIIAYSAFSLFSFYQELHIRNFGGASQVFLLVLSWFSLASMVFGYGFLLYLGWNISWAYALLLIVISFVIQVKWFRIEVRMGISAPILSLVGFIVIPVAGFFMWWSLP